MAAHWLARADSRARRLPNRPLQLTAGGGRPQLNAGVSQTKTSQYMRLPMAPTANAAAAVSTMLTVAFLLAGCRSTPDEASAVASSEKRQDESLPRMMKLYKRDSKGVLHYHEAWVAGREVVEHWGVVGKVGRSREHAGGATVRSVLADAREAGFAESDSTHILIVEYRVEGMGTLKDLEKRHSLEDYLNDKLGWNGLGHCDGGSIGSGTMEVALVVVEPEIATQAVGDLLKGTRFSDFERIYVEN